MEDYMKKPCQHCPFRNDVKPFLHPERAAELAFGAQNPYWSFACHKTTVSDEDIEDGDMIATEDSKECAGMLTLRAQEGEDVLEGFEPSHEMCYTNSYEMIDAYEQEWNK